jgi:hypothetical protein
VLFALEGVFICLAMIFVGRHIAKNGRKRVWPVEAMLDVGAGSSAVFTRQYEKIQWAAVSWAVTRALLAGSWMW